VSPEGHHHIAPAPYPFHNRFGSGTHGILAVVQQVASAPWDRIEAVDRLRRQVATIEALMFACDAPPILITLVEDLYQSIDRLDGPAPACGQPSSLLDAG
jgi:hypothetical protein